MPFDPSKPFDVLEPETDPSDTSAKSDSGGFDPSKPFEVIPSEPVAPAKTGFFPSLARGANIAAGSVMQSLDLPEEEARKLVPDPHKYFLGIQQPLSPDEEKAYQSKLNAARMKVRQSQPFYQAGKYVRETGEAIPEPTGIVGKAGEMVGGFLPTVAAGPAAPLVIGTQTYGQTLSDDFAAAKKQGLSDEDAAARAMNRAEAAGLTQAAIWELLPGPVRSLLGKLTDKAGASAVKQFLARRAAATAQGAIMGATSTAAQNVTTGRPVGENVLPSALGMGAVGAITPSGLPRKIKGGEIPNATTQPQNAQQVEEPPPGGVPAQPGQPPVRPAEEQAQAGTAHGGREGEKGQEERLLNPPQVSDAHFQNWLNDLSPDMRARYEAQTPEQKAATRARVAANPNVRHMPPEERAAKFQKDWDEEAKGKGRHEPWQLSEQERTDKEQHAFDVLDNKAPGSKQDARDYLDALEHGSYKEANRIREEYRAKWAKEADEANKRWEEYKSKFQPQKADSESLVKAAIKKAKEEGPSPEFRALFGGIDPELAGTTPDKVQAFAKSLGMEWRAVAKAEGEAVKPSTPPATKFLGETESGQTGKTWQFEADFGPGKNPSFRVPAGSDEATIKAAREKKLMEYLPTPGAIAKMSLAEHEAFRKQFTFGQPVTEALGRMITDESAPNLRAKVANLDAEDAVLRKQAEETGDFSKLDEAQRYQQQAHTLRESLKFFDQRKEAQAAASGPSKSTPPPQPSLEQAAQSLGFTKAPRGNHQIQIGQGSAIVNLSDPDRINLNVISAGPQSARGQGTGTALLDKVKQLSGATGKPVTLEARPAAGGDPAALNRFYEQRGFVKVGDGQNGPLYQYTPEVLPAVVIATPGEITHNDIIAKHSLKAEDVDQRGFVGPQGWMDRETTAQATGLPTAVEPGRQHATDSPRAGTPKPSGYVPPPVPQQFKTLRDLLDYRDKAKQAEIAFYKSLGLSDADANRMFAAADNRSNLSTEKIEAKLSPENKSRLEQFSTGEGSDLYQFDRMFDPENVEGVTDKPELASNVVSALSKENLPTGLDDRMVFSAASLMQLRDNGGTWSDIAKALDAFTTSNAGSAGDKEFLFRDLGAKIRQFAQQQGIELPPGELGGRIPSVQPARQIATPAPPPHNIITALENHNIRIRNKKASVRGEEDFYAGSGYTNANRGAARARFATDGMSPDRALQALKDAQEISPNATVEDMWNQISKANDLLAAHRKGETPEAITDKFFAETDPSQANRTIKGQTFKRLYNVGNLGMGDSFEVNGVEWTVSHIDPDGNDIQVKNDKGHIVTIPDNSSIAVDHGNVMTPTGAEEAAGQFGPGAAQATGSTIPPAGAVGSVYSNIVPADELSEAVKQYRQRKGVQKATLAERMRQWMTDIGIPLKDTFARAYNEIRAIPAWIKEKTTTLPEYTNLDRRVAAWQGAAEQVNQASRKLVKEVRKTFQDRSKLKALSNWINAGGDRDLLARWASLTKDPALRKTYEDALTFGREEEDLARRIRQYHDEMLAEAQRQGALTEGLENYLHRYYKPNDPALQRKIAAVENLRFSKDFAGFKKRYYDSDFEAEQAGLRPEKDAMKRIIAYNYGFSQALIAREFVKAAYDSKAVAKDGRPEVDVIGTAWRIPGKDGGKPVTLIKPRAHVDTGDPLDWRGDYATFTHPAFRNWTFAGTDSAGNPILVDGEVRVHPDFEDRYNALFKSSWWAKYPVTKALLRASTEVKQVMLQGPFHLVSITTAGLEHRVMPWMAKPIEPHDPNFIRMAEAGLFSADHSYMMEGISGGLIEKIPLAGEHLALAKDWLFNDYIPRYKLALALELERRNMARYADDIRQGKITPEQVTRLSARQAGAVFGGQNMRTLYRSKTFQDTMRMIWLAPDFEGARLRQVLQATGKYGHEQRMALVMGALGMIVIAKSIEKALTGKMDLSPKHIFSVTYNGREYGLRSPATDLAHLIKDPIGFVRNRFNPVYTRPVLEMMSGRDSFGRKRSTAQQVKDEVKQIIPIPARGLVEKEQTIQESFLNSLGVTEHRRSDFADMMTTVNEWKKQHHYQEPGEFVYDPDADPYHPLTSALSSGSKSQIATQLRDSLANKGPAEKVKLFQHYARSLAPSRPFTGSALHEHQFLATLSPSQKQDYQRARAERLMMWRKFLDAWRLGNTIQAQ